MTIDSTPNKSKIGANAMLGASMVCLRATVGNGNIWQHLSDGSSSIPVPLMNILNGGAHANSNVDVQEFMVVPHGFDLPEALRAGTEIYHSLRAVLKEAGLLGGVGDEGGFAPNLPRNEEGLRYVVEAITRAGYAPGEEVSIALDVASQEFLQDDGYHIDGKVITGSELGLLYSSWLDHYPIVSIEDLFGEDDWDSWVEFVSEKDTGHKLWTTCMSPIPIVLPRGSKWAHRMQFSLSSTRLEQSLKHYWSYQWRRLRGMALSSAIVQAKLQTPLSLT